MADVVVVHEEPASTIIITEEPAPTVVVATQGPEGPPGATGPAGPPGSGGGAYRHVQGTPASTWTIAHGLGYYPAGVVVRDSGGTLTQGRVSYPDINTVVIEFFVGGQPAGFSGEAFLS